MPITLGPRVRLITYLVSGIGSAVVAYLATRGSIGDAEVALWAGLVGVVNGISAANVPSKRDRGEAGQVTVVEVLAVVALVIVILWLVGGLPGPR